MAYYGDENQGGVNGHFYHVFNTVSFFEAPVEGLVAYLFLFQPLYYKIPEDAVL
jgi:hypothetical protein